MDSDLVVFEFSSVHDNAEPLSLHLKKTGVATELGATYCLCSVAQSCPTLCNPFDCSLPDSSVHGIFQARILEWVAISSSRASSQPRDQTLVSCVSCIGRWTPTMGRTTCLTPSAD